MQVLDDLGIEATQGSDGRILLADGRVVGQRPPSPVGSVADGDEEKSVLSKSVDGSEGGGEASGGGSGGGDGNSKVNKHGVFTEMRLIAVEESKFSKNRR